ncbi:hypothetical protein M9H77_28996 [Catharanthus roseus]|uniref:Uncharacterized protein n=1 Tax=Catharanthus roseus TaxID=4058 RepID=A0ACC0AL99_CATRO|nr:hypothetical protein M9H77_28996 [Catharanthus roseus]
MAHHFIPSDTQTSSLLSIDPNMGILTNFPELSPADLDNSNFNIHNLLNGFSQDCFFSQLPEFPGNLAENFPAFFPPSDHHPLTCATNDHHHQHKKRKEMDDTPETSNSANSSPPVSENGIRRKNSTRGRGKKAKCNSKEEDKPKDVVHVRARRGQATDSHSLAERVRREKINERLRCLQDIVPGCHKTMGMAVMLDEIINYVQSLQNQVEFLSMKLTAASTFYNFNAENDTMDIMQQRAKAYEAMKMQKLLREGCDGGVISTQIGLPLLDLTFGSCPSLPYNT